MFKLDYKGKALGMFSIGAQSEFYYGLMSEFNVEESAKFFRNDIEFNKLLIVNKKEFYISTHDILKVYNEEGKILDLSGFSSGGGDEARMESLLTSIMPDFDTKRSDYDIQVMSFGITSESSECNDCWSNRGCKLNGCSGKKCNWDAGYKCCTNETGSNCS